MNTSKYMTAVSALIGQALTIATLVWGGTADAKYLAIAVGVAAALGVHVTHVNSTKPTPQAIQAALMAAQQAAMPRGVVSMSQPPAVPQRPAQQPPAPPTGA